MSVNEVSRYLQVLLVVLMAMPVVENGRPRCRRTAADRFGLLSCTDKVTSL
jgi:hypothetical protein